MSGIAYDLRQIKGIAFDVDGVLSPTTIPMSEEGVPMRMANIKDGYALQLAIKKGLKIAIITGGDTPSIEKRYNALGIMSVYLKAGNKRPVLERWMTEEGLGREEVAYVGDDIPDLQAMEIAGLKVTPKDGAKECRQIADYISPCDGGYGVARDLLEQVMKAQGMWLSDAEAFGW